MADVSVKRPRAYRPDIDGLRAVAVLLVVGYHLGFWHIRGGYVGVDIFFVISGFLIGGHIFTELREGHFSFAAFYERRVRRIFPALFAMLFVVGAVAYATLLPTELVAFARSAGAAALSLSNVQFFRDAGYFDTPSASKPLLHTWSLGVEEQFYLALPLVLALLWRQAPRQVLRVLVVLSVVSFIASVVVIHSRPDAAFFLAPYRAWELLLGTLIAVGALPKPLARWHRELLAMVGLALITWAAVVYTPQTLFPGAAALAPCIGTALIILAGSHGESMVGNALSLPPATGIGRISYSLYLWHWPLVVFTGLGVLSLGVNAHSARYLLLIASVVLATLSWRFVEQPFRYGALRGRRRLVFAVGGLTVAGSVLLAGIAIGVQGWPGRFPTRANRLASYLAFNPVSSFRQGRCFIANESTAKDYDRSACLTADPRKPRTILLVGDSHAAHLWHGLSEVYSDASVLQATASGCKAVIAEKATARPDCRRIIDYALKTFLPSHPNAEVVLASRWTRDDLPFLDQTVRWMKSRAYHVTIIGPMPEYDGPLPRLLALGLDAGGGKSIERHEVQTAWEVDTLIRARANALWHVPYVSLTSTLCNGLDCVRYASADSIPLQFDYGHLTAAGSHLVATRLRESGAIVAPVPAEAAPAGRVVQAGAEQARRAPQ